MSGEDHAYNEAVSEGKSAVDCATDEIEPYQEEPLADAKWISAYRARRQRLMEINKRMERHLARHDPEETW